jgi:hypothetical protein
MTVQYGDTRTGQKNEGMGEYIERKVRRALSVYP